MQKYFSSISKLISTKTFKTDRNSIKKILYYGFGLLIIFGFIDQCLLNDNIFQVISRFVITFILSILFSITTLIIYSKLATSKKEEEQEIDLKIISIIDEKDGIPATDVEINISEDVFMMDKRIETYLSNGNYDLDNTFVLRAGPLDISKIAIKSITYRDGKYVFNVGFAAFRDIYFTHYFCDNIITDESSTEEDDRSCRTLRRVLSSSICKHYKEQMQIYKSNHIFEFYK